MALPTPRHSRTSQVPQRSGAAAQAACGWDVWGDSDNTEHSPSSPTQSGDGRWRVPQRRCRPPAKRSHLRPPVTPPRRPPAFTTPRRRPATTPPHRVTATASAEKSRAAASPSMSPRRPGAELSLSLLLTSPPALPPRLSAQHRSLDALRSVGGVERSVGKWWLRLSPQRARSPSRSSAGTPPKSRAVIDRLSVCTVDRGGRTRRAVGSAAPGDQLLRWCRRLGLAEPRVQAGNTLYRGFVVTQSGCADAVWETRRHGSKCLRELGISSGDSLRVEVDWVRASTHETLPAFRDIAPGPRQAWGAADREARGHHRAGEEVTRGDVWRRLSSEKRRAAGTEKQRMESAPVPLDDPDVTFRPCTDFKTKNGEIHARLRPARNPDPAAFQRLYEQAEERDGRRRSARREAAEAQRSVIEAGRAELRRGIRENWAMCRRQRDERRRGGARQLKAADDHVSDGSSTADSAEWDADVFQRLYREAWQRQEQLAAFVSAAESMQQAELRDGRDGLAAALERNRRRQATTTDAAAWHF
eukprot:TRINITY_DN18379_c0_g1_i1.p1 TRINITY_DN18379_c0_g1~~TRINITY_DN18379_c0_g1_i1.p1  ORF type:complete len:545 (+),score=135.98 TRINITY_DN18379_c0_g1_i1:50-1636(+)